MKQSKVKGYYTQYQPKNRIRVLFYSQEFLKQFEDLACSVDPMRFFVYDGDPVIAEFEDTEKNRILLSLVDINDESDNLGIIESDWKKLVNE